MWALALWALPVPTKSMIVLINTKGRFSIFPVGLSAENQGETKEFVAQLYNMDGATDFTLTYPMDSLELLTDNLTML